MEQYETFGQAISRLMQDKGCTVKDLTNQMGLKSSNTIARILADKSSGNKIKAFYEDLLCTNGLQLVEFEKQQLERAIEISLVGVDIYKANKHMLYFVQERPQSPACICKEAFGQGSLFISTLDELFQSYGEYEAVSVMLQNCALGGVTRAIRGLLERCDHVDITVEQYVNASEDRGKEMLDFISLLDVMGHPKYSFFFSPHRYSSAQNFYNVYGNVIVALKRDKNGNKFTDIVTFHTEDSFTVLYNLPGEASYQFHLYQFHALRLQHNPVKATRSSQYDLNGMLEYTKALMELDESRTLFSIRPDISLCMVPPDILQTTINQLYDKIPTDDRAAYEQYIEVLRQRHALFLNPAKEQCYLFSKGGFFQFIENGRSKANVFGLRDLTYEERIRVLKGMIEVAKTNPLTKIHLLKNELRYNDSAYLLYGKDTLLIDHYLGFRNYDPTQCYNACWVNTPRITEGFVYFIEQELLPHYTYSHEETIAFLENFLHRNRVP